jgi:hypothetical protein
MEKTTLRHSNVPELAEKLERDLLQVTKQAKALLERINNLQQPEALTSQFNIAFRGLEYAYDEVIMLSNMAARLRNEEWHEVSQKGSAA